ncbi:Kcnh1, partial [Symbiodinium pilosum]
DHQDQIWLQTLRFASLWFSWSIILLLAVLWDAVTIPLQLFDLGAFSLTLDAINNATIMFWFSDIPVSCFTAVDRDGVLDFRPRSCIHDYLRGWCVPDVLMVLGVLSGTKAGDVVVSIVTWLVQAVLDARTNREGRPTWADGHLKSPDDFRELYALSLHWSLTQFTPSTQDIGPSNVSERIFAAGVVIFALIVFSSFVSSITNQMNQIRTWNSKNIELDAVLRHFLRSRKISTQLGVRITNFFKISQKQKAKTPLESISFLASLPESLKIHLYSEIFLPAFKTSGLFSRVMRVDYRLLSKTCSRAFKEHYCPPDIDIFIEGATAAGVLVVHHGDMTYQPRALSRFTHLSAVKPVRLQKGVWISEASLWCVWSYAGSLRADTACDFHLLDSDAFSRVCQPGDPEGLGFRGFRFMAQRGQGRRQRKN